MKITEEELEDLRKYKHHPDEDDIRYKEIIKKKLLENNKIIYLLNNEELEQADSENDDYFGINILPYYMINATQTNVKNYICFETGFRMVSNYNTVIKNQQIIFYVLCHYKNVIERLTGIARHDVISAEIINMFQGCNYFGNQLVLVSDVPSVTDNDYATRTLIFEQQTPNSATKYGTKSFNLR